MTSFGPVALIRSVLACDDATAHAVAANLGGVLNHEPTRAFLARMCHLSITTKTARAARDDVLVNEGKRQVGLFLVSCNRGGMNLDHYFTQPAKEPDA